MDKNTFVLTPAYDKLLRGSANIPVGLYHLQLATAVQLCHLHYSPGVLTTVKARLKDLVDHGYVVADSIPTKTLRKPYYYALSQKGLQYLESVGLDIHDTKVGRVDSYLFIDHSLDLTDILIAAIRLKVVEPRFYLARFLHERQLKRAPYKVTVGGQPVSLIPDMFLDFHQLRQGASDMSLPILIEHDRGTEEKQHFCRRIRAYKAFLQTGAYKQSLRTNSITVCFTTFMGRSRIAKMREWTKTELASDPQLQALFLFGDLTQPLEPQNFLFEPRWFTLQHNQPIALLVG